MCTRLDCGGEAATGWGWHKVFSWERQPVMWWPECRCGQKRRRVGSLRGPEKRLTLAEVLESD